MTEEFLWHIWKFRLFDNRDLRTTSGEEVKILKVGEHHADSGPDFFNARIKIGGTEWAGNVEIHANASDWHKHKHTTDKAYDNIILHVVHEADEKLFRKSGEEIPTLELKDKIPQNIYGKYLQFKSSKDWIPCEKQFASVDKFTLNNWLDRLLVERLERKSKAITDSLNQNKNNWEETFYQMLARNFGQKINSEPFELLAKSLPVSFLARHKNNLMQIESLLFGTAGMLEKDFKEDYPNELKKEFKFLKSKFKLKPMDSSLWKFMRLHPPNFPTIRISQFANSIYKSSHLFSKTLEATSVKQIINLLNTETSEYWQTHYRFDTSPLRRSPLDSPESPFGPTPLLKERGAKRKRLGSDSINTIIINTIVPFLFVYGKEKGEEKFCDNALLFLEKLSPENNSIISKWKSIGVSSKSSYETQALLQLKNEYCSKKRCLECSIGAKLLAPSP